jgi:hypothetical protein
MSYQGHTVNFSQVSDQQFNALMMEVGRTNQNVKDNRSFINTYPQISTTASARSDTDIWNHLNRYVWGKSGSQSSPKGNWSADPNAIVPNITKNTNAIKRLEAKIQSNKDEHGYFHDTVQSLGDSIKAHSNSPHNQGGGGGIMSYLPLIAVGGLAAYLLKRKK